MAHLPKAILSLALALVLLVCPVYAARDTDSYDGNIFPISVYFFFLLPNLIVGVLIRNQKATESVNHSKPGIVANLP